MKNVVRNVIAFIFLFSIISTVSAQTDKMLETINSFNTLLIEAGDSISYKTLLADGILKSASFSTKSEEDRNKINAVCTMLLVHLSNDLKNCHSDLKILNYEDAKSKSGNYVIDVQASDVNNVLVLYCKDEVITHYLFREGRIAAFATFTKGGWPVNFLEY